MHYLPFRRLAIKAHLLPSCACASMMIRSSSGVHPSLRTVGLNWLCHLSRHCLPIRPFKCEEINDQLCGPNFSTSRMIVSSSYDITSENHYCARKNRKPIEEYLTSFVQERFTLSFIIISLPHPCCSFSPRFFCFLGVVFSVEAGATGEGDVGGDERFPCGII